MTDLAGTANHALSGKEDTSDISTTRVVLDTSVLIADPACLHSMGTSDVVIPLTVIEELDGLKGRSDDVGRAARTALRTIEELRLKHGGSLAVPVPLGEGSLRIEVNGVQHEALVEHGLDPAKADNRIIGAALGQSRQAPTMMVSNDAALRIKAAHLGLSAMEHQPTGGSREIRQTGWHIIDADTQIIDDLYRDGVIDVAEATHQADHTPTGIDLALSVDDAPLIRENEFVIIPPTPPRAGSTMGTSPSKQRTAVCN